MWKQNAEAFAPPQDTMAAQWWWWWWNVLAIWLPDVVNVPNDCVATTKTYKSIQKWNKGHEHKWG